MLPRINPTSTNAWQALQAHFSLMKGQHMRQLFRDDPKRFEKFSILLDELLFDYSKNIITGQTMELLGKLAEECKLREAIDAVFNGEPVNVTEKRPVLHTALRNFSDNPVFAAGEDVMPLVKNVLARMEKFCSDIHEGNARGFTGKRIKYVVNIGIGGSDLGPQMVTEALTSYHRKKIKTFFVTNVDGAQIAETLKNLEPERTLFIISSKTFTTQETMANASTARQWFLKKARSEIYIKNNFVAVTADRDEATRFGIDPANIFEFWDWVGGRFSLWGAIGLSIALAIGFKNFEQLLQGAHAADQHFFHSPFDQNIPVIMGLIGIWYRNFFGSQTEAILPYDQFMHRFPAYLQQAVMESNGKSVDRNGEVVDYSTGPIVWGEPGTNGQHAFFQLLHQGTPLIPCDFIAAAQSHYTMGEHHRLLLSNFFAQTEALMNGKTEAEAQSEMEKQHLTTDEIARLLPYKIFSGNRPGNSFLFKKITPHNLGMLIALYEHKIFVQGLVWNIYSFDQWGVELGKQLSSRILPELNSSTEVTSHDASTNGLINTYLKMK